MKNETKIIHRINALAPIYTTTFYGRVDSIWYIPFKAEWLGSYEWWRKAHLVFFNQYADEIGVKFNERSKLVLEKFIKVYPI